MRSSILVVDDHAICANLCAVALRALGARAVVALDADEAFDRARREAFDAIFIDLEMPGQDGMALAARLRLAGVGASLVLVTGHDRASIEPRAVRAGFATVVAKPVSGADLARALKTVLT